MSKTSGGQRVCHSTEAAKSVLQRLNPLRMLVVDEEQNTRVTLGVCLEAEGHEVVSCGDAQTAMKEVNARSFDLIFLDLRLGLDNGLDLIPYLLTQNPRAKVIVITACASVATAVEAMKRGATDYLAKPFTPVEVQLVTRKVAERRTLEWQVESLRDALDRLDPEIDFPTENPAMQHAISLARRVAASNTTVLISGESGTGKGWMARAIHSWSGRAASPFGVVSCNTTDSDALEEELFGTTGQAESAAQDRIGRVVYCESGTVLLDQVGHVPPSLQPRLLRLLSEKEYERGGDFRPHKANVRFIATSDLDLDEVVKTRRLRPELLLALDVVRISIPPLRERPEDFKLLAKRFLAHYSRENHRPIAGICGDAMHVLTCHTWPGNTRELRNVIERAVFLCDKDYIEMEHLPPNLTKEHRRHSIGDLVPLEIIEEMHLRGVFATTGTIKGAAAILGINPSTLSRRLKRRNGGNGEIDESGMAQTMENAEESHGL